jgi:hypothetical protein
LSVGADGLAAGKKFEARMEFLRSTPADQLMECSGYLVKSTNWTSI